MPDAEPPGAQVVELDAYARTRGARRGAHRGPRAGADAGAGPVRLDQPRRAAVSEAVSRRRAPEPDAEADPHEVARAIVLRRLEQAPRSRRELEQILGRTGCEPHVARAVLDRLTEVGLVDDAAFAQVLVRSRQSTKALARHALAYELRRKGIRDDTARQVLDEVEQEEPGAERRRAFELVERKLRTMHGLGVQVQMRRLAGMLARKGYNSEVTMSVIRDALAERPEHQRD